MEPKSFFAYQYARVLMAILLGSLIIAALAFAYATHKQATTSWGPTTISVSGEGEVLAKPDIGQFSFSVRAEGEDAASAQEQSAEAIDAILTYLKDEGVEEKDLKTQNYWLNPTYSYEERICPAGSFCPPGERVINGYEVNQNVSVKVRDLDSAGDLISGVGERGATNISGLSFTIDDETVYQAEARAKAIADAQEKAQKLAEDLDVRLVKMTGYWEHDGSYAPKQYSADSRAMSLDVAVEEAAFVPELPTGENTIRSSVELTFEVR